MGFLETVSQARAYLRENGRVSLRGLRREFGLEEESLEDLIAELADVQGVARRSGEVLEWVSVPTEDPGDAVRRAAPEAPFRAAERRQLTVVFIDLVGSTAMSEGLDPEEFAAILEAYQDRCRAAVSAWGGYVAGPLGDGLVVYFGFPRAQEDATQRAVRAGLEILGGLPALNLELERHFEFLADTPLQVRIGVHTGLSVVGDIAAAGTPEQVAVGDTPNLAARIQALADPDELLVSDAALGLVAGIFHCEDRGEFELKGIRRPVRVHRVREAIGMHSRLEEELRPLTPLVGRDGELASIEAAWQRTRDGAGQQLLLCGEPGIGKTRLIRAFRETISAESYTWLEGHASPYTQGTAFFPWIELVRRRLAWKPDEEDTERFARLEDAFRTPEVVAYLAPRMGVPLPDDYRVAVANPAVQRRQTMDAIVRFVLTLAERQPLVLHIEDLHWADPSTLELLTRLWNDCALAPVLLLLSFRPEFEPPWPPQTRSTRLDLGRLRRQDSENLVRAALEERTVGEGVLARLAERGGGVPIFLEELARMAAAGGGSGPEEIPMTLQDSLMARLDGLGEAKDTAQLGATLGREFSFEMLAAVSANPADRLRLHLDALVAAEFLLRRRVDRDVNYVFKHALVRDMAYQSLLRSNRQKHHATVARVLDDGFGGLRDTHPELVAQHFRAAGPSYRADATTWLQRAGERALALSAPAEALTHLDAALAVLRELPDGADRDRRELGIQLPLGTAHLMTGGYSQPQVGTAYNRAFALCESLGHDAALAPALFGLWRFFMASPDFHRARELGGQLLSHARAAGDPGESVLAHYALGSTEHLLGHPRATLDHMEEGLRAYQGVEGAGALIGRAGIDPAVTCHSVASHALFELGLPDEALACREPALALAASLGHAPSEAFAVVWTGALLSMFRRDIEETERWAERAIPLCEEHGIAFFLSIARLLRGWARTLGNAGRSGVEEIEESLGVLRAQGTELFLTTWLALLAEARLALGDGDAAGRALDAAFDTADRNGEAYWRAELHRLRGQWQRANAAPGGDAPDANFRAALEVARTGGARAWALRAAVDWAEHLGERGEREKGRDLLSGALSEYPGSSSATSDLERARGVLGAL